MKQKMSHRFGLRLRRVLSGVLCAVMLCGLLPEISLSGSAQAVEAPLHWSNDDLQTLNDYDIMRGNENGDMMPDKSVTRAEFVAMVNRSLGYSEKAAKIPFRDVADRDWFSDDVSISYNMGYFSGTANATASPHGTLTREQALVLLSRNLMLQPSVGESFSYADTHSFGSWSRGYIDPAVEAGIIDANRSEDFNPTKMITRGELAGMLVRTIGARISTPGLKNLGTVDGNVTITTSNVTLRNTTINGDLYLTGGIGLGEVHLDNVTVNGKIIDAGAGLSEKGDISVILNNVSADELVVDSMRNQTISLRTSGTTSIPKTSVRTPAYLDDSTSAGYGLRLIEIDGEDGTAVTLSGNIKEVHNKTPKSSLNIGEGVADKVTVDEAATGSTVTIGKDARVKELNLDTGIKVDGGGSIDKASISANGATVAQLPDEIIIAPGITATVNKQKMDTAAAVEASSRPRLSSGYPYVPENNVSPTGATALFMTNKPGTVYWALTAKASGSPSEEDIITPPAYAKYILKSGKIQVKESSKEYTAKISGLTSDGSYYLSAILVDGRGTRSAMKVTAFDTPDSTTPAFSTGYPTVSPSEKDAQLSAMTTKNCYLYYTVLPKGSTAPRGIDFQTGSITGNLGYGVVRMAKNSPAYIYVNDVSLEEKVPYVLYLWLTDFDGAKSSAVKAVNFTTEDKTDPIVSNLRQTKATSTSVTASYMLNEPGTLYWAAVKAGDTSFMSPATSGSSSGNTEWLSSRTAMERVLAGTGALKSGRSAVAATKVGADVSFTVSGLNSKTTGTSAYDLYYVAVDAAGNWSKPIKSVTIYTDDKTAPTVEMKFTSFGEGETEDTSRPLANTNIRLVFSKPVRSVESENGYAVPYNLLETSQPQLGNILRKYVQLFQVPTGGGTPVRVVDKNDVGANGDWVIDYTKARVYQDGSTMVLEFPNDTANPGNSALRLDNGATYYFLVSPQRGNFQDTTANHNEMAPTTLRRFTTMPAQFNISTPQNWERQITVGTQLLDADFMFQMEPQSTNTAPDGVFYDIMIWCNATLKFDLYRRTKVGNADWSPWETTKVNSKGTQFEYTVQPGNIQYQTIGSVNNDTNFKEYQLNKVTEDTLYQYAVNITSLGDGNTNRETWNLDAEFRVTVDSGSAAQLSRVANRHTESDWNSILNDLNSDIESIGNPDPFTRTISISDSVAPILAGVYPTFTDVRDISATMNFQLDRRGTIYYVVTPVTLNSNGGVANNPVPGALLGRETWTMNPGAQKTGGSGTSEDRTYYEDNVPLTGVQVKNHDVRNTGCDEAILASPGRDGIISKIISDPTVRQGNIEYNGVSTAEVKLDDLMADTWYYVYLMFEGNRTSDQAVCYKFKTSPPIRPILSLSTDNRKDGSVDATVTESSGNVTARLLPISDIPGTIFSMPFNMKANATGNPIGKNFLNAQGEAQGYANTYTVLDAMINSVGSTGSHSVFDMYASDELQDYIANQIKSGNVGGVIKWGTTTIRKDASANMRFNLPNPNVNYVCVAVAENMSQGGDHGFRAIRPVQVVDETEPEADTLSGNLILEETMTTSADGNTRTYSYALKGTLTVQYANFLYRFDSGVQQALPFTQAGQMNGTASNPQGPFKYPATNAQDNWYGVQGLYAAPGITIVTSGGAPQLTREFTIEVNINAGTRTSTKTTAPLLDKDGKPVMGADNNPIMQETWSEVTPPTPTGTISLPSDFVNRSNIPATVKKNISYTTDRNGNVTVRLR